MQMLCASAYEDPRKQMHMGKAYHSYFTKSIPLLIRIQIKIYPLSTDGAIVLLVS